MNFTMSPNDIWNNLSRQQQNTTLTDTVLPALAVFGAGMLVGAGVALLTAPKPGRELRSDIATKAGEFGDTVRDKVPALPMRSTAADELEAKDQAHA